ncbi:sugar kinase [Streptomyces sp. NBC_00316]|uniref:sugar kinase n=1 Tax=Streptomyces sp. NBC_00316 TaxID=2975710 RepID=UPI002E2D4A5A|nr:sugar kinase [Streptomyces sp. NBC_00316]
MPEVITFGEAMVVLHGPPGVPLSEATGFTRGVAGAEANVAVGLARLGHEAAWFGRTGDDAFGDVVLRTLRGEGVDVSRASLDPKAPTGLLVRDCHSSRRISVAYYRAGSAGSRLDPTDVDTSWLAGARVLHSTGITPALSDSAREATHRAVDAARAAGVTVSLDPNIRLKLAGPERWRELLRPLAGSADLVLTGEDEAELVSGRTKEAAVDWFLEQGAELVVVKRGALGATATDGVSRWEIPVWPVTAMDPVGAGDAFDAGFLSGRLRGLDVPQSLGLAARVAAMVVASPGDLPGLPRLAELSGPGDADR